MITTVGLTACPGDDDDDDPLGGDGDITGTWALQGAETDVLVRITANTVVVYERQDSCYLQGTFDIVDVDGDIYTLEFEGFGTFDVEIQRVGSNLEIDSETFVPSNVNVASLEICEDIAFIDPDLGQCSTLPQLGLPTTVEGSLTTSDATDPSGYHYDQYRLELTSTTNVQIGMTSAIVDAFILVYQSNGTLVGFDDDSGSDLNSLLQVTLEAGCYVVVATSFDPAETGSYTLQTSTF